VLEGFAGTLLFVSHDRYLIDALAQQLWALQNGRLVRYAGGYSEYAAGTAQPLDRESAGTGERSNGGSASPEERLQQLEEEIDTLAGRLADLVTTTSPTHLLELMDRYAEVQQTLRDTQDRWLEDVRQVLHSS
jgi:ATP-binding cassette subfamily F protein 3